MHRLFAPVIPTRSLSAYWAGDRLATGPLSLGTHWRSQMPVVGGGGFAQAFRSSRPFGQAVDSAKPRLAGRQRTYQNRVRFFAEPSQKVLGFDERWGKSDESGTFWGLAGCVRASSGGLRRYVRATILCNQPLPADLPRAWCHKKDAPLPARIQITCTHQTTQNSYRLPEKPITKRIGCLGTPSGPIMGQCNTQ